ncbi:MAG: type VI secretion system protein TssL [Gammaproteobacteria bacterium]|nr:type VI secretion system protein TssL [Gammaproteobacteria bacterium]
MDENECPKCEAGLPPWLATFADLMSLLMCFFVLLLSFSEIDAIRFKKMAESMKDAFGVQREIPATEIVMGTSVIKQEFSPSTIPEPSPMDDIRQQTQEDLIQNLKVDEAVMDAVEEKIREEVEQQAEEIKELLQEEINDELVIVETEESRIIIRIQEKGSFPSGSAKLNPGFLEVMDRISGAVATSPGRVIVAGHTDNIPISTARFRSNWELSSARAVTVLHALLDNPDIDQERVQVEGHADSQPLESNDTAEDRAVNRRVEIILERGGTDEVEELLRLQEETEEGGER